MQSPSLTLWCSTHHPHDYVRALAPGSARRWYQGKDILVVMVNTDLLSMFWHVCGWLILVDQRAWLLMKLRLQKFITRELLIKWRRVACHQGQRDIQINCMRFEMIPLRTCPAKLSSVSWFAWRERNEGSYQRKVSFNTEKQFSLWLCCCSQVFPFYQVLAVRICRERALRIPVEHDMTMLIIMAIPKTKVFLYAFTAAV